MEDIGKFFLIFFNRIIFAGIGAWVRKVFFNVPYGGDKKRKKGDYFDEVIDTNEYINRVVGFAVFAAFILILVLMF